MPLNGTPGHDIIRDEQGGTNSRATIKGMAGDDLIRSDVNGDAIFDLEIEIHGGARLGAADFLL